MKRTGAVLLLGVASTLWAALPLGGTGTPGVLLVVVALACLLAGLLRLIAQVTVANEQSPFASACSTLLDAGGGALRRGGWESLAAVALVALEALHHSRPWHTGLLVLLVVCYLWAVHATEPPAPVSQLRSEARLLAVSLPLAALAIGVAMLPAAGPGPTSGWLEIVASLAAITAGALALPI